MITFFQTKISAKQSFYATDEPNADNRLDLMSNAVIPAKAGIQCMLVYQGTKAVWIPAFAGMTMVGSKRLRSPSIN